MNTVEEFPVLGCGMIIRYLSAVKNTLEKEKLFGITSLHGLQLNFSGGLKMKIIKKFYGRIDYEEDVDNPVKFRSPVLNFIKKQCPDMDLKFYGRSPVSSPFVTIESEDYSDVEDVGEILEGTILKHKGAKLL